MKIAHLCLSNFFADGLRYQENELVREHVRQGHEVVVLASRETYGADQQLNYVAPGEYVGVEGARVVRVPYRRGLPLEVARKLRMHPGTSAFLDREQPDAVMFHSLCGAELLTAARWARHNGVIFQVDSHEDYYNSARGFGGRLLHRWYYRPIVQLVRRSLNPVLCISLDTIDFVCEMYGLAKWETEFFPLGGHIPDDREYNERRARGRLSMSVDSDQVLFLQSGKFGSRKRLDVTLRAFAQLPGDHARLALAGSIDPALTDQLGPLIDSDNRVAHLGWCDSERLLDLLCACDVYVQPGTQSVTMQQSLCCRSAVIIDDVKSHGPFVKGNGWLVSDGQALGAAMMEALENPLALRAMAAESLKISYELLDYTVLAERVLSPKPRRSL